MYSKVFSAALFGIEGRLVSVEADVSDGLPLFSMVGYLNGQVKEAHDRVKTAIKNSGIRLMPKKITINLSPADMKKTGTGFDLPVAIAVLAAYGLISNAGLETYLILGELSLNGEILPVRGVFPMVEEAAKHGIRKMIVPKGNLKEATFVHGAEIYGAAGLTDVIRYFRGEKTLVKAVAQQEFAAVSSYKEDFAYINGQKALRRAGEVAAAGMHNLLLEGPPGSGKSMLASCLPSILPPISKRESAEVSRIYSTLGMLSQKEPLMGSRPFRAPHHTTTKGAMAGGGIIPRPGEISMAHGGILFLDELPEFKREVLEILRQPMEEKVIRIFRSGVTCEFPADFMLVAAMNPCKCGFYPNMDRCTCTPYEIRQYRSRISMPFLDRIDMSVETSTIPFEEIQGTSVNESSALIRERVWQAHHIQKERFVGLSFQFNRDMNASAVQKFCSLNKKGKIFMKQIFEQYGLSARAYLKVLKVARTIADLEGAEQIHLNHLCEAVCYRQNEGNL